MEITRWSAELQVCRPELRDTLPEDGVFAIADLGTFSMREIYDALVRTKSNSISPESKQGQSQENDGSISDCSDSSWTTAEDTGEFYINIRRRIDNFMLAPDQTTLTTELLSRRQRRFVHATSQVMRLGHASLGANGKYRRMVIFKNDNMSLSCVDQMLVEQSELVSCLEDDQIGPLQPVPKKRKRVQRIDNGFPCRYPPCSRLFNRASERTKHEEAHQPALTSRYQCNQCASGFRYPKDLRRHQKTHWNTAERDPALELLSSSYGSMQTANTSTHITSTLSSESRIPSDISLNFHSNPASRNSSPRLVPWSGDPAIHLDLEPLMLADDAWAGLDGSYPLPCDAFGVIGLDQIDGCDEGFLEMARVKKPRNDLPAI